MARRGSAGAMLLLFLIACGRIPSARAPQAEIWYVESSAASAPERAASGLIHLDTASLRPVSIGTTSSSTGGVTVLTSFQGSRYHPEAVRAVSEDSSVLEALGVAFTRAVQNQGPLVIDVQDMSPDDIPRMTAFVRIIAAAFRSKRTAAVAIVVPAGDTVSYPTAVLGRVADRIIVRLADEHRPGTRPGPLVTPDFIRRAIGSRATSLGASRLGAEFPLYGYIWNADGSARAITFRNANELVIRESGSFRRDPGSGFLSAGGRAGWTIWVPDSRTVQTMVNAALKRGVRTIVLAGITGADPAIFARDSLRQ